MARWGLIEGVGLEQAGMAGFVMLGAGCGHTAEGLGVWGLGVC